MDDADETAQGAGRGNGRTSDDGGDGRFVLGSGDSVLHAESADTSRPLQRAADAGSWTNGHHRRDDEAAIESTIPVDGPVDAGARDPLLGDPSLNDPAVGDRSPADPLLLDPEVGHRGSADGGLGAGSTDHGSTDHSSTERPTDALDPVPPTPVRPAPGQQTSMQPGLRERASMQPGPGEWAPIQHSPGRSGPGQPGPVQSGSVQHAPGQLSRVQPARVRPDPVPDPMAVEHGQTGYDAELALTRAGLLAEYAAADPLTPSGHDRGGRLGSLLADAMDAFRNGDHPDGADPGQGPGAGPVPGAVPWPADRRPVSR